MNLLNFPKIPQKLITFAKGHLQNGRPNWDLPHTRSVVYYAYRIANSLPMSEVDTQTIVTAAILHDIGYAGLFAELRASLEEVKSAKKEHMRLGSIMTQQILTSAEVKPFYTLDQIDEIAYIVRTHDNLKEVACSDNTNLRVVVESDTLGAIDPRIAKPTFNRTEGLNQIESIKRKRAPLFVTETGEIYLNQLLDLATDYYQNLAD